MRTSNDTYSDDYVQNLEQKPEGKRPLEKLIRKWKDSIKMDLICDGKDLIQFICAMIWAKVGIL
jgi:hypothetical protein